MKLVRGALAVLVSCAALGALAGPAAARVHLDRSFGDQGAVDLRPGGAPDPMPWVIGAGPEGRIFVSEQVPACSEADCPDRIYLKRYQPDGKPDREFGGGRLMVGETDGEYDVVIDSTGRLLVALQEGSGVVIQRFRRDGSPDRSFGGAGSVVVPCGCHLGMLKVGPGRKPVLIASSKLAGPKPYRGVVWVLARLRKDGSRDRGFGGDGIVRHPMPGFFAASAEVEPGGGTLLYGELAGGWGKPFVQRLSGRGRLERRYAAMTAQSLRGVYGMRRGDLGWENMVVVLHPDGRVEVFGGDEEHNVAVGLLANGKRNPGFGRRGVRPLAMEVTDATPDGRGGTLIAAYVWGKRNGYRVMRMLRDGRFDRRFGRVGLPASDEQGVAIFRQGRRAAIVYDPGLPFCRQGCEAEPKLFRVIYPRR